MKATKQQSDLLKAIKSTLILFVFFFGLYGALLMFTFIWTLPLQIGLVPDVAGASFDIYDSSFFTNEALPVYVISIICTFISIGILRVSYRKDLN
jgi:hypothetical protein